MKVEKDPFKATILEGLQLAYKLTANSLYGQIGAELVKYSKKLLLLVQQLEVVIVYIPKEIIVLKITLVVM